MSSRKAPGAKMGRPPFVPTKRQREDVEIAAGGGMPHEHLATALGITTPTLRKHFAAELSTGAHRRRLDVIRARYKAAMQGRAGAIRQYLEDVPAFELPPDPEGPEPAAKEAAEPIGKKAQAQAEAQSAHVGTDWAEILGAGNAPPH